MRQAWLIYGSMEERTGGTIYDREIVRGLRARGEHVDVISLGAPGQAVRDLARLRPDVIVGDELCHQELAFIFPRVRFARRVLLVHHLMRWEKELRSLLRERASFFESKVLRDCDHVIATSQTTRARLLGEGCRRSIDVVLPGADRLAALPHRAAAASEGERLRFLFVGAVIPRKRVLELVRAFDHHHGDLVIAGALNRDVRYVREVRAAARSTVQFLGDVDETTLARELSAADVLVMPSTLEGYGIAATEAIAAGTPVIAAPGLEEAVSPCAAAALLTNDLRGALDRFATDVSLRQTMRVAAKREAMPRWSDAAAQFLESASTAARI